MRRDHTTFRYAARLTLAATALSFSTFPCLAGTTTIFAPGVTANSGWYDVNKKSTANASQIDFVACGAAAASNMLQYWQDGYTTAGNILPNGTPDGIGTKEYTSGLGCYELAIFEKYLDCWGTEGTDPQLTIQWSFTGEGHNVSGYAQPQPETTDYGNVEITQLFGLTAYPIPEPSVFGLLAGVFALALGVSRRRRK